MNAVMNTNFADAKTKRSKEVKVKRLNTATVDKIWLAAATAKTCRSAPDCGSEITATSSISIFRRVQHSEALLLSHSVSTINQFSIYLCKIPSNLNTYLEMFRRSEYLCCSPPSFSPLEQNFDNWRRKTSSIR